MSTGKLAAVVLDDFSLAANGDSLRASRLTGRRHTQDDPETMMLDWLKAITPREKKVFRPLYCAQDWRASRTHGIAFRFFRVLGEPAKADLNRGAF